jgi:hypothetical protein
MENDRVKKLDMELTGGKRKVEGSKRWNGDWNGLVMGKGWEDEEGGGLG